MGYRKTYKAWLAADVDEDTRRELLSLEGNEGELEARFSSLLEFGTAGLRGHMGAGIGNMNIYTVGQATQAIADIIKEEGGTSRERGVCIAFDSRRHSDVFARHAACVLAQNKIKVYLFDSLRPTPELSFAVRHLNAIAGINITASHNPKEYNGYKAYWEDGAQISPKAAARVASRMADIDMFGVETLDFAQGIHSGIIEIIGSEVDRAYLDCVFEQAMDISCIEKAAHEFKVVFTPLHGAGYRLVPQILERIGIQHIIPVTEQLSPDGDFPTIESPNPENKESFTLAFAIAKKENADLIIGTDPDGDRLGIAARRPDGEYDMISGNQTGALMLDYIIKSLRRLDIMPKNPIAVKTIVSTEMARKIANTNNVEIIDVLTGFRFIGEKIKEFEETQSHNFIFGYEESHGYLKGTYCRDKDAIVAAMIAAEMACWYKTQGMTLFDALEGLYGEYGCYLDHVINVKSPRLKTTAQMRETMKKVRQNVPESIGGQQVTAVRDYLNSIRTDISTGETKKIDLPQSDVLYYELTDGSRFIIRPSGTEPKIKIYLLICGETMEQCEKKRVKLEAYAQNMLESIS